MVWSNRFRRETVSPLSRCQAITIFPFSSLISVCAESTARRTSQRRQALFLAFQPFRGLYHGIGLGPGTGAASQIADAQGGSGGVGMSNSLPWLAADPPIMQVPVNVSMFG